MGLRNYKWVGPGLITPRWIRSGSAHFWLMPNDGFGFGLGSGKGIKARSRILDGGVELDLALVVL